MKKEKGYSIWLIPEGKIYQELFNLIKKLGKEHSSPVFEPHVTLLNESFGRKKDLFTKAEKLASSIRPFKIELSSVGNLDEYNKCLFIKAEKTKELKEANLKAKEIFNHPKDKKYFPHLSLMYGNFPEKTKKEIIKEIGSKFNLKFLINSFYLVETSNDNIKNWKKVKEIKI